MTQVTERQIEISVIYILTKGEIMHDRMDTQRIAKASYGLYVYLGFAEKVE